MALTGESWGRATRQEGAGTQRPTVAHTSLCSPPRPCGALEVRRHVIKTQKSRPGMLAAGRRQTREKAPTPNVWHSLRRFLLDKNTLTYGSPVRTGIPQSQEPESRGPISPLAAPNKRVMLIYGCGSQTSTKMEPG